MIIKGQEFHINGLIYTIRSAADTDAEQLSEIRVQIDGETENMDREAGEGFIDKIGFQNIIKTDSEETKNLFLVAEVHNRIVGFSRCEGSNLKRLSHKVEFGVCILKEFWGYRMGKSLLQQSIHWADENEIKKISLQVLETNEKAIQLYKKLGFEIEGILKNDKKLSDEKYYNTVLMGRCI
ncbi:MULTISPECIES: GNAT family N-acetyltransferase [Bacillus]|uniref:GNAT family N-acetyltransferase n=1 Tax=Bacillus TaxID=1386 RepID=UPI001F586C19|nr:MULTISPECIES: GNAT family N-acetyltransferase [Bacillus cereus group]MDA1543834.1 GNAT family N-acetyltransferase [Bacillus cereus group sp. TH253LC]MDA1577925.1 GNAT family N-acetyltransferase [Bacillus cereus group sp. TH228LC]MDA1626399.1 GNAT family N-acetyltransferase [Bacillus cereus group sp. TH172LC]MDA1831737.1 GNAT family N-acetyltransferase [Bacillus cereus group sp. BY142LC]MDA1836663.1 GNAT family N-acetyltransferase [Bacillus cereus group sp. BY17LC]